MINSLFILGDFFERGFVGIILILDTLIYGLISSAFRIFMAIAGARLLSSEAYTAIANKVYLIIGVLMLFVLSYGILKAIVNPDEGTKQMGPGLLKKIAIAVVGLAVSPALFNLMYQAQGLMLEHDVLAKLFFRSENTEQFNSSGSVQMDDGTQIDYSGSVNPDDYVKNIGGAVTATTIWQAFFYPAEDSGLDASEIIADPSDYLAGAVGNGIGCAVSTAGLLITAYTGWTGWGAVIGLLAAGAGALFCTNAVSDATAYDQASKITTDEISLADAYVLTSSSSGTANFGIYIVFLENYVDDGEISYLFGISTLCGAFVLYAFASFSIDMGIRAAKLAYFQVIAPIPLVMQILPGKEGVFKDYTKKVIHTFLEVFIRISVVYIVVYLICHLSDLFSSADALWGNTDLSTPELMFAMAFLIIGLIIFCKEAPKFFGETLGINSGNMSLGLRKKLAEGGVYNAAGIGYGGLTSAVRNWRNSKGRNPFGRIASTVAGFGSGAARATKSQLIGPDKHQSMNWRDAKNAGERAAQAASDKRDERAARQKELQDARQQIVQAESDIATQEAALAQAIQAGDTAAAQTARENIANARRRLEEAQRKFMHATALGTALDNTYRKLDSWSIGSVSLEQEESDMRFADGLKKLRDDAREIAYKKAKEGEGPVKQLKQQYEELQATKISEYREGWDEESFNQAVRDRVNTQLTNLRNAQNARYNAEQARDTARVAVQNAQAQLDAARASGVAADITAAQAVLGNAQADLTAREAELVTRKNDENNASSALEQARANAVKDVEAIAKRSQEEVSAERAELQRQIKRTKDLMEAAADEWVAGKFGESGSDVQQLYQSFLNNNANYISDNSSRVVYEAKDANGTVTHRYTVREMLEPFADISGENPSVQASASNARQFVYKDNTNGTFTYTRNADGTYRYIDPENGNASDLSVDEFFLTIEKLMTKNKDSGATFEASTASTTSSKAAKTIVEGIPMDEGYRDKVRRKRQADDNKSGKK